MRQWLKANGGPLAVVLAGLTIAGFRTSYGWVLVGVGVLGLIASTIWSRSPFELRRKDASSPQPPSWEELNAARVRRYQENQGLFLIHTWQPSSKPDQVADVEIKLCQHGPGPFANGEIRAVEYTLGPKFSNHSLVCTNADEAFAIEVSMWGPMLCLAKIYFTTGAAPLLLERYINFESVHGPDRLLEQSSPAAETSS